MINTTSVLLDIGTIYPARVAGFIHVFWQGLCC